MTKSALVGGAALVGVLAIGATGTTLITSAGSTSPTTTPTFPPPPANLHPVEVGPNRIKVSFGPSISGAFMADTPAPDGRSIVIRWGNATDELDPLGITYSFYKNNKLIWKDRKQTYATVGFTLNVTKFTTCVVAHSINGYGPKHCTTWTGIKP